MSEKTAIVYVRVSTADQAEEELPIDSQVERCKAKAAELGARVVKVFADEGRSGRTDMRQPFQDSISYCEAFKTDFYIVWSTARLFRNKFDAAIHKRRLDKVRTKIIYVSQPIDRDTDIGWMMEGVFELFDEWYSRAIAADTLRSMQENARQGRWNGGNVPFGYQAIKDPTAEKRKRLDMIEAEAAIVRRIYKMRLSGDGAKTITATLNENGISYRGRPWKKSTVLSILKNQIYIGNIVFNRKNNRFKQIRDRDQWIVVKSHEPIIPIEQFESVQHLLNEADMTGESKSSMRSMHVFTGMLYCANCGSNMTTESAKGRSKRYYYYNCTSAIRASGCKNRRILTAPFDEWLVEIILDQILNEKNLNDLVTELHSACGRWAIDQKRRRTEILRDLSDIEKKRSRLFDILERHGRDAPNLGDLAPRLRQLNEKIKLLEGQLSDIETARPPEFEASQYDVAEMASLMRELINKAENPKKLRQFFASFIDKIMVENLQVTIEYRSDKLVASARGAPVPSVGNWLPESSLQGTKQYLVVELPSRFKRVA